MSYFFDPANWEWLGAGKNAVRLAPPLVLTKAQADTVLRVFDGALARAFYVEVLGFGVTERLLTRAGPLTVRGTFLHCNRRHHSIALFDLPIAKRLHHFMLEAVDLRDEDTNEKNHGYNFDVPATAGTVYRVGSVTKQFTAAAVMRLAQQYGRRIIHFDRSLAASRRELPPPQIRITRKSRATGAIAVARNSSKKMASCSRDV